MFKNKYITGILIAIVTAVIFGIYPAAARAVYTDGGNPAFIVLATTLARAVALAGFCILGRKKLFISREDIKMGITGGFLQAASVSAIFGSLLFIPGPIMITIIFTHTIMLLFFMAWKKEVQLSTSVIVNTFIALIGLSFALDVWHETKYDPVGIGLAFIGAIITVSRLYVFGSLTKARNPAVVGAESFIFAAIFVMLLMFFWIPELPTSSTGYFYTFLACISQAIASFGMFYGISILGAFQWSLFAKLEPIFTAFFSFFLINEVLNETQYVGIGIVIVSLIVYQLISRKPTEPVATARPE